MGKINGVVDIKTVVRAGVDCFSVRLEKKRTGDFRNFAQSVLGAYAGFFDKVCDRQGGTVHNGDFLSVNVAFRIVYAKGEKSGKQMFHRGNMDFFIAEACGEFRGCDREGVCFDYGNIFFSMYMETNAGVNFRRKEFHFHVFSGMKPDTCVIDCVH